MGRLKEKKPIATKSNEIKRESGNVKFKARAKNKESSAVLATLNHHNVAAKAVDKEKVEEIKAQIVKQSIENKIVKETKLKKSLVPTSNTTDLKKDKSKINKVEKKISKKEKMKQKKKSWQEKINVIKSDLKEKIDKAKREKTTIVGDIKPLSDSLNDTIVKPEVKISKKKEEKKNSESKAIPKESKRTKQSLEDIATFSQLLNYKQFTDNPLETLKKHFNKK